MRPAARPYDWPTASRGATTGCHQAAVVAPSGRTRREGRSRGQDGRISREDRPADQMGGGVGADGGEEGKREDQARGPHGATRLEDTTSVQ